ncbi:MAG: lysylphosphatidylglycerol synthase transmembrane domain-containing protein [Saprospiraceae bacterium]
MKGKLANALKFLGFLSIGMVIITLVYRNQDAAFQAQCVLDGISTDECSLLDKLASDLSTVKWAWLGFAVFIFMISNFFRAWRWQQLIEPLGKKVYFWNAFWSVMIGYFANLGLPRMGEVVRAGLLGRYEGIAVEKVMGTVVVDRILDVVCLLVVIGLAFALQWETLSNFVVETRGPSGAGGGFGPLLAMGVGVLVVGAGLVFWLFRKFAHTSFVQKITKLATGFAEGLRSLTKVKNKPILLFNTVGIWACYFGMAYLPFFSFPPTEMLGFDAALMVFVFSALGIVIPSPGGLGSYHFMVIQALALFSIAGDDALSFANILFFTVQIGVNVLFGIIGLIMMPIINGGKRVSLADTVDGDPSTTVNTEAV